MCRANFSFNAAFAKSAGDENAGDIRQMAIDSGFERLGIDQTEVDAAIMARRGVGERFVNAFVSVLQIDVFADDRDLDLLLRVDDASNKLAPIAMVGLGRINVEETANEFVQSLLMQEERHFVNGMRHVTRFDYGVQADIAEQGELLPDVGVERAFGAAKENLRLETDLAQLGDALLGRFGLEFACGANVGHEGDVHVDHVFGPDFENELPDGFEEGQAFDIADGAADFRDDDVDLFGSATCRMRALISSVTCGMTCTVLPR